MNIDMDNVINIDSNLSVARFAPCSADLKKAAEQGFMSIVNFRTSEEKQEVQPGEEQRLAERAGLTYLHHPVSVETLDDVTVDIFRHRLAKLPTPVLLHCASGKRAGAMALMARAVEDGLTVEEAIALGQKYGLDLSEEKIGAFVKSYADRNA